jgi:hypothetical protein
MKRNGWKVAAVILALLLAAIFSIAAVKYIEDLYVGSLTSYGDVAAASLTLTGTSSVWDPGSLADGVQESKDFTVTGAALGDGAVAGAGVDVTDIVVTAVVTATNTVTVTLVNETGGTLDLASSTWYVYVILDD